MCECEVPAPIKLGNTILCLGCGCAIYDYTRLTEPVVEQEEQGKDAEFVWEDGSKVGT